MSDDFGKSPCTCTRGPVINGHVTWIINRRCPVHGLPDEDYPGKKK